MTTTNKETNNMDNSQSDEALVVNTESEAAASPSDEWAKDLLDKDKQSATSLDQADGIRSALEKRGAIEPVIKSGNGIFGELDGEPDDASRLIKDQSLIMDIPVDLSVEIGRAQLSIKNILALQQGSVVELNCAAGEPMVILVNGKAIAMGEVVVVNEKFGVRLTDVIDPQSRMTKLGAR